MSKILKNIILFFLVMVNVSCEKDPPLFEIQNLNDNEVLVLGHGGSGRPWKFPVDSRESIQECLEMGADGSEMDIQMTKDSVLVAFHHEELDNGSSCEGKISETNWSDLKKCTFNASLIQKINLMRVEDIFNRTGNLHQYYFTFDCKFYTDSEKIPQYIIPYSDAVLKIINDFEMENNIMIESPNMDFLNLLQNKKSNLKLFIYTPTFESGLQLAEKYNLFGITIDLRKITRENADLAHEKGLWITLWNVKTQSDNMDALQKNPDIIQTNKIHHLLKITGKN